MSTVTVPAVPARNETTRPPVHLVLINPPALAGRTNERTFSGGIGVSRKLKPFEREAPMILPIDFLYLAAVAERAGCPVTLVDLLIDRHTGRDAERFCLDRIGPARGVTTWVGVRLSMPSLMQDLDFANRMRALLPAGRVFVFGAAIMATIDHWIGRASVDYVLFGEPEAFFDQVLGRRRSAIGARCPLAGDVRAARGRRSLRRGEEHGRVFEVGQGDGHRRAASARLAPARHVPLRAKRHPAMSACTCRPVAGVRLRCSMCPYMLVEGLPWRKNEVDAVVDEIEYLNQTFGIYRVRFRDPNFGFNRQYARALAEAIIARGVKLEATVETSLEVLEEETLRKLFQAGIRTITTGVETNDAACMESIGQQDQDQRSPERSRAVLSIGRVSPVRHLLSRDARGDMGNRREDVALRQRTGHRKRLHSADAVSGDADVLALDRRRAPPPRDAVLAVEQLHGDGAHVRADDSGI